MAEACLATLINISRYLVFAFVSFNVLLLVQVLFLHGFNKQTAQLTFLCVSKHLQSLPADIHLKLLKKLLT